jgi:hypothetical protein
MAIRQKVKFLISASFWGIVIGLVALYYTVRGTRTSLIVDVISESNVMDVRTPLKDLAILFQGQDIQKENANLRILGVRLVNEGEANILESYFDSKIPWGLRIEDGQLIEARVTGSNSQYLSENLHPKTTDKNDVTFDKVIFDKGKYIALELLVLHNKNVEPKVTAIGKIAGMDDIPVRSSFRERDQEGLASRAFKGPIAIQIARTLGYFFVGLSTVLVVGFSIAGLQSIPSRLRKRARRKRLRQLAREESPEKEKKRQVLLNIFVEEGTSRLKAMLRNVENDEAVAKALSERRFRQLPPDISSVPEAHIVSSVPDAHIVHEGGGVFYVEESPVEALLRAGLVERQGKAFKIVPEVRDLLSNLITQLSEESKQRNDVPSKDADDGSLKGHQ